MLCKAHVRSGQIFSAHFSNRHCSIVWVKSTNECGGKGQKFSSSLCNVNVFPKLALSIHRPFVTRVVHLFYRLHVLQCLSDFLNGLYSFVTVYALVSHSHCWQGFSWGRHYLSICVTLMKIGSTLSTDLCRNVHVILFPVKGYLVYECCWSMSCVQMKHLWWSDICRGSREWPERVVWSPSVISVWKATHGTERMTRLCLQRKKNTGNSAKRRRDTL